MSKWNKPATKTDWFWGSVLVVIVLGTIFFLFWTELPHP